MNFDLPPLRNFPFAVKFTILVLGIIVALPTMVSGQTASTIVDTPQSRMRPLGSPSAVDRYQRARSAGTNLRETAYQRNANAIASSASPIGGSAVRQTAMQFDASEVMGQLQPAPSGSSPAPMAFPPQGGAIAQGVANQPGGANPSLPLPNAAANPVPLNVAPQPVTLPASPSTNALPMGNAPSGRLPSVANDLTPLAQPTLGNQFATVNNCANVTGPSGYSALMGSGCAPVNYQAVATPQSFNAPQTFAAPPAQVPAPAVLPPALGSIAAPTTPPTSTPPSISTPGPASALMTFGQQFNPVQVGPGLLGQPKAYVPGQYFRNWLRYFTP